MAHQESVLSPETDLFILMPARSYTASMMTLYKSVYENAFLSMCACSDFCTFALNCIKCLKFTATKCQLASWHLWIWFIIEVGERRRKRETLENREPQTKESIFCLHHYRSVVAVGGVGLSKASGAVMKTVSQKTQTGCRPLIDQGNFL